MIITFAIAAFAAPSLWVYRTWLNRRKGTKSLESGGERFREKGGVFEFGD